jgi:pimeloyl-ACP methyl ester carboxylesterase
MVDSVTLVLFPGMAADSRIFAPQRALPFPVLTPDWPPPEAGEDLPAYARRVATGIDWPARFVVGGVSFGGMVAAELAAATAAGATEPAPMPRPMGLILIASSLTGRSVPGTYRFVNALTRAVPDQFFSFGAGFSRQFLSVFGHLGDDDRTLMADMLRKTSVGDIRRWADMIMHWQGPGPIDCPRLWIHGDRDLVIPLDQIRQAGHEPEVIIPGGSHLMSYTDAERVNEPIERFVRGLAGG